MSAQESFDLFLREHITPLLSERGFKKKGSTFGLRGTGVWGILNFQKDRWSTRDEVGFTINVSLFSDFLGQQDIHGLGGAFSDRKVPAEVACHWRERIGSLFPARQDTWWRVPDGWIRQRLIDDVQGALVDHAIPWLRDHRSDEAILEDRGFASGSPTIEYAILLSKYRPSELPAYAAALLQSCVGRPSHPFMQRTLERFGYMAS